MRITPFVLVFVSILIGGCAGHSAGCTTGTSEADCAPGTAGYEQKVQQQEYEKSVSGIDDARCLAYGADRGSLAYEECRRKATASRSIR
jgi:hypothetical protein